jgi:hypothetical protein
MVLGPIRLTPSFLLTQMSSLNMAFEEGAGLQSFLRGASLIRVNGKPAKIQPQACSMNFFWYKFETERVKLLFVRRQISFLQICGKLKSA